MKVNLNDTVYVKLTESGVMQLRHYYSQLGGQLPAEEHLSGKFQLWELMYIFGRYLNMMEVPFEKNEIHFTPLSE